MILRILDKTKNPIMALDNMRDLCVKSSLDFSDKSLSFSVPWRLIDGVVVPEGYIETKTDRFVIKEVNRSNNGEAEVFAQLDIEDLEGRVFREFVSEEQDVVYCVRLALSGTTWTVADAPTLTKKRTIIFKEATALDVIKQCISTYRYELEIDSLRHELRFVDKVGSNKGVYFARDLNLRRLTVNSQSYDLYTEIEPYGADDIDIGDLNGGKLYLSDYSYTTKKKRFIWKDERYSVVASLKEDAEAKLHDMAKPLVSYEAEIADLAKYSAGYSILDYAIGDEITLVDDTTGTKEVQRIVGLEEYPNEPLKNSCTLANKTVTFSDYVKTLNSTAETLDLITVDNGTIDGATINQILSRQIVDLENAIVQSVYIQDLDARFVTVSGKLSAVEAEVGTLNANVANFETATAQNFAAVNAVIESLRATDLAAANARIEVLDAGYAAIKYLLAGNQHVEILSSVTLNSSNATISDALIRNGVVDKISINDLMAVDIITNRQRIISNDGSFEIDGSTQTIRDENGNVRIQIGKDGQGNFTFVLYDATGNGVLIDATGIKESAIADGLIKDAKVAADAAIQGSKLDIASVYTAMNDSDGSNVLKAYHVWLDEENLTLNQAYKRLNTNLITVTGTVDDLNAAVTSANIKADEATRNAQEAIRALEGITALDSLSAWLENDAHVVHTYVDGTGGNYADAVTRIHVMKGELDITSESAISVAASPSVEGVWDPATYTYQVTNLTDDNGYVDFVAGYGSYGVYPLLPGENRIVFPDDKRITMTAGSAQVVKRFSISKARDGRVGTSYKLVADPAVVRKMASGELLPASVKFSAFYSQGPLESRAFAGIFTIDESTDGVNYATRYTSPALEHEKTFVPSLDSKYIRATLRGRVGGDLLDQQSITVVADADELRNNVSTLQQGFVEMIDDVANIASGVDGLNVSLRQTNERITGITDGNVLWSPYKSYDNGVYETHRARIYRVEDGEEVTSRWNHDKFYRWTLRTADESVLLGYGVTCNIEKQDYGYGAVLVREFNDRGWPNYDPDQKAY